MLQNQILTKTKLAEKIYKLEVFSPYIVKSRKAGQFVMVRAESKKGERIPLTIADWNNERQTISLVFQVVGKTTQVLSELSVGEAVPDIAGPLGSPTHVDNVGTVVVVGGGVGIAPLYPIAYEFNKAGNEMITILGARSKDYLIYEEELKKVSKELIVMTDDGSYGEKGFVTNPLKKLCETRKIDMVIAIGPAIMMKNCVAVTREYNIKTMVSLNTIMVDGTGMCGGCRVEVGGVVKFVCVDGPEFDGLNVDFDKMIRRLNIYKDYESVSLQQKEKKDHVCKIS